MAIRSKELVPDVEVQTRNGVMAIVSREQLAQAVLDGVAMLDVAGGMLSVILTRAPTGFPNEMATTGGAVTWQDRTDAKPQPERATAQQRHLDIEPLDPDPEPEVLEAELEAASNGEVADGIDEDELPQEDVSSIPQHLR
jgi:hypothetical protein